MKLLRILAALACVVSASAQTAVTINNQTRRLQPTVPYIVFPPTGLRVDDTDASHQLTIKEGSNLTAAHTFTLETGDADRTLTMSGNATIADWFDQSVKSSSSPTFVDIAISSAGANSLAYLNGSKSLSSVTLQSNLTLSGATLSLASALTNVNTFTAASATDLMLNGGSSGGTLTLGQGANGGVRIGLMGTGVLAIGSSSVATSDTIFVVKDNRSGISETLIKAEAPSNTNHTYISHDGTYGYLACDGTMRFHAGQGAATAYDWQVWDGSAYVDKMTMDKATGSLDMQGGITTRLGVTVNAPSDTQLFLNAASGQRYISQYWQSNGVTRAQSYLDSVTNTFYFGTVVSGGSISISTGAGLTALTLDSSQGGQLNGTFNANRILAGNTSVIDAHAVLSAKDSRPGETETIIRAEAPGNSNHTYISHDGTRGYLVADGILTFHGGAGASTAYDWQIWTGSAYASRMTMASPSGTVSIAGPHGGSYGLTVNNQSANASAFLALQGTGIGGGEIDFYSGATALAGIKATAADTVEIQRGSFSPIATFSPTIASLAGNLTVSGTTGISIDTAGATMSVRSGANAAAGTVTLVAGAATITSTAIDANTVIVFSEKTAGGTPGLYQPLAAVTTGSAAVTSAVTDTSTYNWIALKVN